MDAFAFYIRTKSPSSREIDKVIESVIYVKNSIISDEKTIHSMYNYSLNNLDNRIKDQLLVRNKLLEEDTSGILSYLLKKNQDRIKRSLEEAKNLNESKLEDSKFDKKYTEAIRRIQMTTYENKNMPQRIQMEREELYRKFKRFTEKEIFEAKVSISLGGSFIFPERLFELLQNINIPHKEDQIREWIHKILEPIEELSKKISLSAPIDAKKTVYEFLEGVQSRTGVKYDPVYEIRSLILNLAKPHQKKLSKDENVNHQKYLEHLMEVVENLEDPKWIVHYNSEIMGDYITYLISRNPEDKKILYSHFPRLE